MTNYELLYQQATDHGVCVIDDTPLPPPFRGLYTRTGEQAVIWICPQMTEPQRACVLAEEIGHHYTSYGDERTMGYWQISQQETRAIAKAIELLLPWDKLRRILLRENGSRWELAEHLGVTEEFLRWALTYYQVKQPEAFAQLQHLLQQRCGWEG